MPTSFFAQAKPTEYILAAVAVGSFILSYSEHGAAQKKAEKAQNHVKTVEERLNYKMELMVSNIAVNQVNITLNGEKVDTSNSSKVNSAIQLNGKKISSYSNVFGDPSTNTQLRSLGLKSIDASDKRNIPFVRVDQYFAQLATFRAKNCMLAMKTLKRYQPAFTSKLDLFLSEQNNYVIIAFNTDELVKAKAVLAEAGKLSEQEAFKYEDLENAIIIKNRAWTLQKSC